MSGPSASELVSRLDDAVTLARKAQRERALAIGQMRETQIHLVVARLELRHARLDLACARELLAHHGLTIVEEEAPCA
jgi:hypothetical protein